MNDLSLPAVRVKHLDHVTVVVKDLEASRRFYVQALGMDEVPRPAFSFDGLWFQAGRTQIHLILEHSESSKAGVAEPEAAMQLSRTHHFAFELDDAYAAANRMLELGIPIVSGPKQRPDGAVQVFVCDPDGHVVELCQNSPATD